MRNLLFFVIATFLSRSVAIAQLPVEVFFGDEKATIDIMFFKFIKNTQGGNTEWLFFNRNRASIDYKQTTTSQLPQFGFTEAVSYNNENLYGFAPVAVVSVLNRGVFPKLGVQYANISKDLTIFTWSVVETNENRNIDFFLLTRYTPLLINKLHLFTQLEFVNVFPTTEMQNYSFVQRARLGFKLCEFQFGLGGDFSQFGRNEFQTTTNIGGFIHYEF